MTHCRAPASCSVCLGAPARVVELVYGSVMIDGVDTGRPIGAEDIPASMRRRRGWKGKR